MSNGDWQCKKCLRHDGKTPWFNHAGEGSCSKCKRSRKEVFLREAKRSSPSRARPDGREGGGGRSAAAMEKKLDELAKKLDSLSTKSEASTAETRKAGEQ